MKIVHRCATAAESSRYPLFVAFWIALSASQVRAADESDLFALSLEELMNLEVTSVGRKSQNLADTTSSVYVVTQEDIARYGIRSIPEALRLVPGMSVLQIDGNKWAITSRGFNGRFANKLLVLMDGRTLYTPSFSGVFWDVQDTLMEEIDRIEVIRGPGSAVWGANAVTGVINIITRPAEADRRGRLQTRVEDDGSLVSAAAFSGSLGARGDYRAFVKRHDVDGNQDLSGASTTDDWDMTRVGFRADWSDPGNDSLTIVTEAYEGVMGASQLVASVAPPYGSVQAIDQNVEGMFVTAQWSREHSNSTNTAAQFSWDYTDRASVLFNEQRNTYSVDVQHRRTYERHDLVFGATVRRNAFEFVDTPFISDLDLDAEDTTVNVFVQDEWTLVPDKFHLVLGTKLEHHDLSRARVDVMPTARLHWNAGSNLSAWAAVTRAIRTPSHSELQVRANDIRPVVPPGTGANPFPVPLRTAALGSQDFDSEVLHSHEIGLRGHIRPRVTFDLSLFDMRYSKLTALLVNDVVCDPSGVSVFANPLCVPGSDSVITETALANAAKGHVVGGELAVDWDVSSAWRIRTAYWRIKESLEATPPARVLYPTTSPEHQVSIRSEWSLSRSLRVTAALRYADDIQDRGLDDFWQADIHMNCRIGDRLRLAFGGRNLLDDANFEFMSELNDVVATQLERSYFVQADWNF